MNMKKKTLEFPDCWEELTQKEWEKLLKLMFELNTQKELTLRDVKRAWCSFVLSGRGIRKQDKIEYYILVNDLADSIDWMFSIEDDGKLVSLNFDSTQNLLPKWSKYSGPADHGADLTFGEFRTCVALFNKYNTEQDNRSLELLCGILYRKPASKNSGKRREDFNKNLFNVYQRRVAQMPAQLKFGVYLWFASFCRFLVSGEFIIDGCDVCFESIFASNSKENNESNTDMGLGMNAILFTLAESGIFGNVDETDNTSLMRTLMKLLYDEQKAKEMRKETKQ